MASKNVSIEMLKFLAACLIVNSHMGALYVHCPQLATGGAIGDALFFFCSGFGLALSKKRSFDNYYKRRIGRIYPAIFAWAIVASFFFHKTDDMMNIVLHGGGWFISCIMVYYIVFWFIHRYLFSHLKYLIAFLLALSIVWFFIFDSSSFIVIYRNASSKFIFFFVFMLFGSLMALEDYNKKISMKTDMLFAFIAFICFYAILFFSDIMRHIWQIQILSLAPLLIGVFFLYRVCCSDTVRQLFAKCRLFGLVGGLCLEIYIVQSSLFTTEMNNLFPLNLLLMFLIIVFAALVLRCSARVFEQLFRREDFDWTKVFSLN